MDADLLAFRTRLATTHTPEDLFGTGIDLAEATHRFRQFVKIAHPDNYTTAEEKVVAGEVFTKLFALWNALRRKFAKGTYGQRPAVTIQSRTATYTLSDVFWGGDLATVYKATDGTRTVALKVARSAAHNDLLAREAALLTTLQEAAGDTTYRHYLPTVIESLRIVQEKEVRAVNVLSFAEGYVPLPEVVAAYPEGVDPRHGIWIGKRLLTALDFAHKQGVKHGAILPPHILVNPDTHGLMLVDWAYGWHGTGRVEAISPGYKAWYAPEVLAKRPTGRRTDLYMAAACITWVLGGDYATGAVPPHVPARFGRFLAACLIGNPSRRPSEAGDLYELWTALAAEVYGPPRFVEMVLK